MTLEDIKKIDNDYHMPTYARFDLLLVKGHGATAYDEKGKEYIDFSSGIGVNSLGFCDKEYVADVTAQLSTLGHTSNLFYTEPQALLAESICTKTGYSKVFFSNSGAEANECAIKLARKYSFDNYGEGRNEIITLLNSFHGRTVTTLSATGQDVFHNYFFPFTDGFQHGSSDCVNSIKSLITEKTCAVMIEPILGEGGVLPLEQKFVTELSALCKEQNLLLICDEVQTGVGRTGKLLAQEHFDLKADIVTLAKGLGGGLPIGACLCNEKLEKTLSASMHATTFGGNPVVCAGALHVLKKVSSPQFLEEVCKKGDYIKQKILAIDGVSDVRGLGLMLGIILKKDNARQVVEKCINEGLIALTAKTLVRFLPPLTISYDELDQGMERFEKAVSQD